MPNRLGWSQWVGNIHVYVEVVSWAERREDAKQDFLQDAGNSMKIVCLGWGSLIWRPGDLPMRKAWYEDGPSLPVEFARQSGDDRITLVVVPGVPVCPVLWTELDVETLDDARRVLSLREGPGVNLSRVAHWSRASASPRTEVKAIEEWALAKQGIHAVVWTALGPRFCGENGRLPSVEEVVNHLNALEGQQREDAEKYVRHAPSQIRTPYREAIEKVLGWTPRTWESCCSSAQPL